MNSGIYKWTNKETGHIYIGQAKNLHGRMKQFLNFNTSYAGNKINEERIKYPNLKYWDYDILEECNIDSLNERELYHIKQYEPDILLNVITHQKEKQYTPTKPKWIKQPHLCPLSYMIAMNKSINKILNSDDHTITDYFYNICRLIHDKRNNIKFNISKNNYEHNHESYIYDTVVIIPTQEVYKDLNISYGATISSWFIVMKLGDRSKNPWVHKFENETLDLSYYIGGYLLTESLDYPITVNKMFYELTKKYYKTF